MLVLDPITLPQTPDTCNVSISNERGSIFSGITMETAARKGNEAPATAEVNMEAREEKNMLPHTHGSPAQSIETRPEAPGVESVDNQNAEKRVLDTTAAHVGSPVNKGSEAMGLMGANAPDSTQSGLPMSEMAVREDDLARQGTLPNLVENASYMRKR